jgi:hypothetical protein
MAELKNAGKSGPSLSILNQFWIVPVRFATQHFLILSSLNGSHVLHFVERFLASHTPAATVAYQHHKKRSHQRR